MTIGQFIEYCENYQYTKEAFEFEKACRSIEVLNTYIECAEFSMSAQSEGVFTEGFLMESSIDNINEAKEAAMENNTTTSDSLIEKIKGIAKSFIAWITKKWQNSYDTTKRNVCIAEVTYVILHAKDSENPIDAIKSKLPKNTKLEEVDNGFKLIITPDGASKPTVIKIDEHILAKQNEVVISDIMKLLNSAYDKTLKNVGVSFSSKQPVNNFLDNLIGKKPTPALYAVFAKDYINIKIDQEKNIISLDNIMECFNEFSVICNNPSQKGAADIDALTNKLNAAITSAKSANNGLAISVSADARTKVNEVMNSLNKIPKMHGNKEVDKNLASAINKFFTSIMSAVGATMNAYNGIDKYRQVAGGSIITYFANQSSTNAENT